MQWIMLSLHYKNYRAQECNLHQGLYGGSVPPVVPNTENLSSKHSRIRSTSRAGSFSNNSPVYRLKGVRPFAECGISFLLEALPLNMMINAYTLASLKDDLLSVKFQSHSNLIDATLHLTFQNKANEKFLYLFSINIELLNKEINLNA